MTLKRPSWPRVYLLLFFAVAAWLTAIGWIRPELSEDISAIHLPLGLWPGVPAAEEILHGPRRIPADSIGIILLAIIGLGFVVSLVRPKMFSAAAAALLVAAVVANAAAAFNLPRLSYLMDLELDQRQQIANVFFMADDSPMSGLRNDRATGDKLTTPHIGSLGAVGGTNALAGPKPSILLPDVDAERGGWQEGLGYVLWGPYLIVWGAIGLLMTCRGPISRRVVRLAAVLTIGVGLAVLVCLPRLRAEYDWARAKRCEGRAEYAQAREAIEAACSACPDFRNREQTWLLVGKLDYAEGRLTSARKFFRAFQVFRNKHQSNRLACLEDLPSWPAAPTSNVAEQRWTLATLDEVLYQGKVPREVAAAQGARYWTQIGASYYLQLPVLDPSGFRYHRRESNLAAAMDAWDRARRLAPERRDAALFQAMVLARLDPENPQRASEAIQHVVAGLADRPLLADVFALQGTVFFAAGMIPEAVQAYSASGASFSLPKIVNHRALEGLGGW